MGETIKLQGEIVFSGQNNDLVKLDWLDYCIDSNSQIW